MTPIRPAPPRRSATVESVFWRGSGRGLPFAALREAGFRRVRNLA
eukprot:CAMPEP_0202844192 /NCGR_PEP_ID=MMETSP1389-20130828/66571_1 /ASSEMBLY_ACC=CAM_ASM_000865 /TAXON_ID=302021 /ORGANISM="Rhodomonas sp., Strain CCMP768" /LENGTH=44 /DNA_ID= /DNA_START= /DNA_END= /DNA_ORIENTATION=